MSNFEFLKNTKEYALFAPAVVEAKRTSKDPNVGRKQFPVMKQVRDLGIMLEKVVLHIDSLIMLHLLVQ